MSSFTLQPSTTQIPDEPEKLHSSGYFLRLILRYVPTEARNQSYFVGKSLLQPVLGLGDVKFQVAKEKIMLITPEQLQKIKQKSQERRAAFDSGFSIPKNFARKGDEFIVRFLPDKTFESARALDEHKNLLDPDLKEFQPFLCLHDQCELCAYIAEHAGLRMEHQYFQWRPSKRTLCYVYVLSYDGGNRYVVPKDHTLLIGPRALGPAILDIISDLKTEDELRDFLQPERPGPVFRLRIKDRGQVELERQGEAMSVPPLPNSWPALVDAYITEGSIPDPAVVKKYILGFSAWAERAINIKPFPKEQQAPVTPPTEQSLEAEPAAENRSPVVPAKTENSGVTVSTNCPTSFGSKPQGFNPICLVCPEDESCAQATEEARKSV